ncbi:response regulator transcription factor [Evansella cellulosilytica]|uniref:Transcriptional regulator, LuxR family n=1 Tax=Evansella cellulosilytica (strain ATCC 21833 / DSM 2522 / FERM P-1141 / JCM 9156 / N-4) TaxID=649639 RepID=E6TRA7_EVAC2|nr:response regulator transcription factor [Evansella cellulosilytica]ADU30619.1 transcriptional regulator, LuxR family [Evansella cellulosilytica DSM 2522]
MFTTSERLSTANFRIIYFDKKNKLTKELQQNISKIIKGLYEEKNNLNEKECNEMIFYLINSEDEISSDLFQYQIDSLKQENSQILIVSCNALTRQSLSFLSLPVNALLSLSYLEKNTNVVLRSLFTKGVFLEPNLHTELVTEIERKTNRSKPFKKLCLNISKVASIFTKKEQEILQLILDGCNNGEIADKLFYANSTVSTNISSILKKMEANDRTEAMVKAIRNGWVDGTY